MIAQAAHMEESWDADQLSLKPIEHEIIFKSTGVDKALSRSFSCRTEEVCRFSSIFTGSEIHLPTSRLPDIRCRCSTHIE